MLHSADAHVSGARTLQRLFSEDIQTGLESRTKSYVVVTLTYLAYLIGTDPSAFEIDGSGATGFGRLWLEECDRLVVEECPVAA